MTKNMTVNSLLCISSSSCFFSSPQKCSRLSYRIPVSVRKFNSPLNSHTIHVTCVIPDIERRQNASPLSLPLSSSQYKHNDNILLNISGDEAVDVDISSGSSIEGDEDKLKLKLREALSMRRIRTEELLKKALTSSNLSITYSHKLASQMGGFVDYTIVRAAEMSKSSSDSDKIISFSRRARLCIDHSGVVQVIKWLKHNKMTFPRIGELVNAAADDLEGLKLRVRWLKAIHVKGRYLGVVLTRNKSILKRSIEDLDCNIQLLENNGVKMDWMGFVISHCPEILSFSTAELASRVNLFMELGMSKKDFGTMLFDYPKVIGFFSTEDINNKTKYLKEFGLSNTDLGRLIAARPHLLGCSIEEGWKPLLKYFYYLGVQRSGMRRLLTKAPSIFCLNLTANIAPKVRFLRAIGVHEEDIGGLLVKFPKFLTYSLNKKTRPVVRFLIEKAGVPEADIGKVIACEPELIGCSLQKLEVTTKYFLAIGIPPPMLGRMIADFPMLLKYNLEVIRPKYRYLKRVMVRPLQDLIEFPRFFSYSLSSRITPRHKVLVENSLNFHLRHMLAPTDEEFTRRVQDALGRSEICEVYDPEISGSVNDSNTFYVS